jgi:hypothetical protein
MRGRIAIGLVLVDGPTEDLVFIADEQTEIVAEVQNGLSWLGSQAPNGDVTWVYDIRPITLMCHQTPTHRDSSLSRPAGAIRHSQRWTTSN